tara:strand:- start:1328 stop:1819 length:492 start_codon:yes stop_codon:yes gene_type:complete
MKFNPLNLYKLHLNNKQNRVEGDGTARFKLQIPKYFPIHKRCLVSIEHAQLQVRSNTGGNLLDDHYVINSNLISPNSYSNSNLNPTGTLCYFSIDRHQGQNGNNRFVELSNPTQYINIGYLPNEIELYISNPPDANEGVPIILHPDFEFMLTICCQFVDDDEC